MPRPVILSGILSVGGRRGASLRASRVKKSGLYGTRAIPGCPAAAGLRGVAPQDRFLCSLVSGEKTVPSGSRRGKCVETLYLSRSSWPPRQGSVRMLQVGIISRHALNRAMLSSYLSTLEGMRVVPEVRGDISSISAFGGAVPTVLLIDCLNPAEDFSEFQRIHRLFPSIRLVLLLPHDDPQSAVKAIEAGAHGCVSGDCSPGDLAKALREVAKGEFWMKREVASIIAGKWVESGSRNGDPARDLTQREWQILSLLARGKVNKEIAAELAISENTVKTHLAATYRKIKVATRLEAVLWYFQNAKKMRAAPPAEHSASATEVAPAELGAALRRTVTDKNHNPARCREQGLCSGKQ